MNSSGLCKCGCGKLTSIVTHSNSWNGQVAGTHRDFLVGHSGRKPLPTKDVILNSVLIDPITGCWNWRGVVAGTGYGVISVRRKNVGAHRLSYMLFVGDIPDRLQILHRCDNRRCCNPDHLFAGTIADNMADKALKGRAIRGESHHSAKLNEGKVRTILQSTATTAQLARDFGVSEKAITLVRQRVNWKHIFI